MKNKVLKWGTILSAFVTFSSCNLNGNKHDATGVFEATEIIVSAEAMGKVIEFNIEAGSEIGKDSIVGKIDPVNLSLQKEQTASSIEALNLKTNDAGPNISVLMAQYAVQANQTAVLQTQLKTAKREHDRLVKLVNAQAAPTKQLDDMRSQVEILENQVAASQDQSAVIKKQIKAQQEAVSIQNRGILSEKLPLQKRIELINDQISKTAIVNPAEGTVLTTYIEQGEFASPGKALYKLANLKIMTLRAYITGDQLGTIKLNQQVLINIDQDKKQAKTYEGKITWISDKAEFTPKTIQTRDERANLVYPIKIKVVNDGFLKIGMYGEVTFEKKSK